MHISLDNVATVAGLLLMFGGLVGAWVETRLKVKQLMRDSAIATERYRECRKVQFEKHDAIIEGLAALKQKCAEDTGELKTIPVCLWGMYKSDVQRRITLKYQDAAVAAPGAKA